VKKLRIWSVSKQDLSGPNVPSRWNMACDPWMHRVALIWWSIWYVLRRRDNCIDKPAPARRPLGIETSNSLVQL
jgi:hypothetical protein